MRDADAADQAVRDARDEYVTQWLREYRAGDDTWAALILGVADAMDGLRTEAMHDVFAEYAETEGWEGVLIVIARAIADERREGRPG